LGKIKFVKYRKFLFVVEDAEIVVGGLV
jgi:hypothetical protein